MAHQLETNLIRDRSTRSADEEANEETAQLPAMIVAALSRRRQICAKPDGKAASGGEGKTILLYS